MQAGHIILTPAKQLMVMGLKIWSLSNPGSNQRPFDHWPTSLPTALTRPTERPNKLVFIVVDKRIIGVGGVEPDQSEDV
jgi:hypothetical protein